MDKEKNNYKQLKYSKKVIIVCLISIWIYVLLNILVLALSGSALPDILTTCFFGVFSVEFCVLGKIKSDEVKKSKSDIDNCDVTVGIDMGRDIDIDSLNKEIEDAIKAESEE